MQSLLMMLALAGLLTPPASWESRLRNPEAQRPALERLLQLQETDRPRIDPSTLTSALLEIVNAQALDTRTQLLAIRTLGHLQLRGAASKLTQLLLLDRDSTERAMAQEAVAALVAMNAIESLTVALDATDPGIRAAAAQRGAGPTRLCALLSDNWTMVRAAAARGIRFHPKLGPCLAPSLNDPSPKVLLAAAETAIVVRRQELKSPLRKLAAKPSAYLPAREAAVVALGALGDLQPARQILATHLEKGGLISLARASVKALAEANVPSTELREALASKAFQIQLAAADILSRRRDMPSKAIIEAALSSIPPRQRTQFRAFLDRFAADPVLGKDIVDDIIED